MSPEVPPEFDLTPLVGCELISVLVGSHHVELRFLRSPHIIEGKSRDDGCRVDVEAGFVLHRANEEPIACDNHTLRDRAASLISLIDQIVKSFFRAKDGALTLVFENGTMLTFIVDEQGFDSYHVHTGRGSFDI